MDINNNQQTNTFIKGMDTDTSDMYIGEGSYRYAENLRVVTNKDSNSGELHIIEGTEKISGHTAKITVDKDNETTPSDQQLLGFTSIRDYIIEIVKHGNSWSIVRVDKQGNRILIAGPFNKVIWPDNWDGKTKPLSLVTRWEADDNIKLYIATGKTSVLSVNIAKDEQGSDFDKIFGAEKITLTPVTARITEQTGAVIPGVVIQYAYVVYKLNGTGTTLSMLSNSVVETINEVYGYKSEVNGEYVIEVTLPEMALDRYVRLYRIAYLKAGQLPRIDIIYDQLCTSNIVYDSGQSIQNVSSAEFIATNKLAIYPKEIESKGDYLFAANVKYTQDKIDAKFDAFDARCYSSGNYYEENGTRHNIGNNASEDTLLEIKNKSIDLKHDQFNVPDSDYNSSYWAQNSEGYNGKGLCFSWKYVYTENELYFENQYNSKITPRTYARNEVYRFGVRLFDMDGNPSSVKWIADIKMPDTNAVPYTVYSNEDYGVGIFVKNISIEFTPRNTTSSYWDNVSKYEIVQAKRSITDSYKITQGIVGFPMDAKNNELCLPYFLSTQYQQVLSGMKVKLLIGQSSAEYWANSKTYNQDRSLFLFASPEYTYQSDDVQNILSKESGIYCKQVTSYMRGHYRYEYSRNNVSAFVYTYDVEDPSPYNPVISTKLNRPGLDLQYSRKAEPGHWVTYLEQFTMVGPNQGGNRDQGPLGGSVHEAKKNTYFTNIYAEEEFEQLAYKNEIQNITYIKAQKPETFASNELPTYKSTFNILPHNSKKLFNWTNPAMINSETYDSFRGELPDAGEDLAKESWKNLTMTSYDNERINWKTSASGVEINDRWEDRNAAFGSAALTFPISPGGPMMALEFQQAPQTGTEPGDGCPLITIANVCRPAIPYGGYNINSINNTQYISGGYYNDKDESTIVSMGDNYITMFVYFLYHNFDNVQHDSVTSAAIQYIVPIESTIDLSKQSSEFLPATSRNATMSTGKSTENTNLGIWVQAETNNVPKRFIQATDTYMYNTAYSITPDIMTYSGQDTINKTSELYDSRIHYSQKKQNNELIDNWTNFKVIDYLDVDSRYGQITGLKLFKDKLIFLQENGAGVLSVNDRIILKDQESANIIVGNGGVLDRYDYFTTMYGMKPDQHVVEASNDALYWWDGHRREIISYVDGYNIALLQRLKNVSNYINSRVDSDTPSIVYDTNNKEVLFNVVKPNSSANGETLVYNEQIQQFTSVYTFSPIYYCNINGEIFLTDNWENGPKLYKYNKQSVAGPLLFGELVYSEWDEDEPAGSNEHEMDDEEEYGHEFGDELPIELMAASSPRRSSRPSEEIWSNKALPKLKFVVNKDPIYNKVFDLQTFGGDFYSGDITKLTFAYNTPLGQSSTTSGTYPITKRECDYRLAIPRDDNRSYGGRMRGKTMECELTSSSNDYDFSIQYITTKYRMSWT